MPLKESSRSVVLEALECSGTLAGLLDGSGASGPGFPIVDLNAPFERFCGDARDSIIGRPFRHIAAPDAETLPEIEAAMGRLAAYRGSLRCQDAGGRERRLGLHLIPNQERRSYVVIGRDITEEARAAEDNRAVQRLLLRSFMVTDRPLAILLDDRIVLANSHFAALLGHSPDGLTGRLLLEFVPPRYHAPLAVARGRIALAGAVCDVAAEIGLPGHLRASTLHFIRLDNADQSRHSILTVLPPAGQAASSELARAPVATPAAIAAADGPAGPRRPVPGPVYIAGTMKEAGTFLRLTRDADGDFGLDPEQQVEFLHTTLRQSAHPLVLADVAVPASGTRAWADTYLEAFINLPEGLRRRLIPIFSMSASTGLPVTTIQRMSQCCAGLGLRVGSIGPPPFNMSAWRPAILAIEAEHCDYGPRFNSFTNLIHSYRAQLLVCGVADAEQASTLGRRGVDILTLA